MVWTLCFFSSLSTWLFSRDFYNVNRLRTFIEKRFLLFNFAGHLCQPWTVHGTLAICNGETQPVFQQHGTSFYESVPLSFTGLWAETVTCHWNERGKDWGCSCSTTSEWSWECKAILKFTEDAAVERKVFNVKDSHSICLY